MSEQQPKQSISIAEWGPRDRAPEHRQLMAEREVLKRDCALSAADQCKRSEHYDKRRQHELSCRATDHRINGLVGDLILAKHTAQQFRMVVSGDQPHRFVLHDHDSIYSEGVDRTLAAMGLTVLKTPVRAPQANAFCERLIGTIRRECLDFLIPLNERHVLAEWVSHYNRGRPHASLGPGIPDPAGDCLAPSPNGHRIRDGHRVVATSVLGGLHHEYRLERMAA